MLYYSEDVLTISGLSKAVKADMAIRATRVKGYHGIRTIREIYHFVSLNALPVCRQGRYVLVDVET